jgi:ADP-ribose pyrophosphatase YjhB (NUDIX family)
LTASHAGSETSSGALVLAEVDGVFHMALAYEPRVGGRRFGLPKGRVETGETLEDTARREVAEETGLDDVRLVAYLGSIERTSRKRTGAIANKTIHVFLAFARGRRELSGDARWMRIEKAIEALPLQPDRDFVAEKLRPLL